MAIFLQNPFPLCIFMVLFLLHSCYSFNPKLLNVSKTHFDSDSDWYPAGATWYGSPNGAGSDGGACGYGNAVGQPPFSSMVSAGGPSLFYSGIGCGACYQVKCTSNKACSGNPITVVITDECPGGPCLSESAHFDLSGTAFGAMAMVGEADQLRNVGMLQVEYRRVQCYYPGFTLTFRIDSGSNPYYFATVVEYASGDGEIYSVELKQALPSDPWLPMQQSWGAVWKLNSGSAFRAPLSLKITSRDSGKTVVADGVIPVGWQPGNTYRSLVNTF